MNLITKWRCKKKKKRLSELGNSSMKLSKQMNGKKKKSEKN